MYVSIVRFVSYCPGNINCKDIFSRNYFTPMPMSFLTKVHASKIYLLMRKVQRERKKGRSWLAKSLEMPIKRLMKTVLYTTTDHYCDCFIDIFTEDGKIYPDNEVFGKQLLPYRKKKFRWQHTLYWGQELEKRKNHNQRIQI